ncbi:PREDICTED: uncharacterized protein LOC106344600 [Brassica oleracea var. oleracea]|uniref:uncharacterized protein LOC106344600 n=1 Tax=Brassica oleracea var. oleracea TaxID=109376 RepID=UPI0006A71F6F|nr:PREDICTED: uncharacterized protein LOC106344600 [Brassica oleracea var. oleracea]
MGRLLDITGDVGTYYLGVARTARVSEAVMRQRCNIRGHRSRHCHALHDCIQNERVPLDEHGRDVVLWKHAENTYESHFSSSKTWDQIRVKKDKQICLMCGERDESRDHIFFACPFTFTVWNRLAGRLCGRRINPDWSLTLQFVTRNTLSNMDKILVQMVF